MEPVPRRLPLDERHHVEQERVGLPGVVQRQDVRVLQVGGGLDLGEEAVGADHRGELGLEHLESDLPVMAEVLGQVHRGHAALAQLALNAVAVGEGGGEVLSGHWPSWP